MHFVLCQLKLSMRTLQHSSITAFSLLSVSSMMHVVYHFVANQVWVEHFAGMKVAMATSHLFGGGMEHGLNLLS